MKRIIGSLFIIMAFMSFSSNLLAQSDSIADKKLLNDITPELNQQLDALKQKINSGEFKSAGDVTEKMYEIISVIENKMYPPEEAPVIEENNQDMSGDGITEDQDGMGDSDEQANMNVKPRKKRSIDGGLFFNFGFTTLLEGSGNPANSPDVNFTHSAQLEYGFMLRKSLNDNNSVRLNFGLSYLYYDFDTKDQILNYDGSKDKVTFVKGTNIKDSDFGAGYLSIPIIVDFKVGRKLNIGVGGYAGIRLNSYSRYVETSALGEKTEVALSAPYNMNSLVYGTKLYFGSKNFGLYAQYNINSIFKDTYKLNPFSIGLRIGI